MNIQKPSIPRGTRDFGPEKMVRRNFILENIKKVYQLFGFLPMETPAMENLNVLTGKYGDEGDQLIFKILNSGNFLESLEIPVKQPDYKSVTSKIAEKALRYDLTVPFARYVVMNRGALTFPFKRFQIQPVWRADRPQKGRYREFYQCDADVVGTDSLLCEAEIILVISETFRRLGIRDYTIKINNRKVLEGIAALFNQESRLTGLTVAIDKIDKIGPEGVVQELISNGLKEEEARGIINYFSGYKSRGSDNKQRLEFFLKDFTSNTIESGKKGISELQKIFSYMPEDFADMDKIEFDVSLARGLSYYTGAIFEVKANNVQIGSICGGGRYDNLTGVFGMPGISGVGISFGVDRIYDVMEELNLFPGQDLNMTKILVSPMDEKYIPFCLSCVTKLRALGIASEIFPDASKIKKQLDYANKKDIPYVLIVGEDEMNSGSLTCKDMRKGEQYRLNLEEVAVKINSN